MSGSTIDGERLPALGAKIHWSHFPVLSRPVFQPKTCLRECGRAMARRRRPFVDYSSYTGCIFTGMHECNVQFPTLMSVLMRTRTVRDSSRRTVSLTVSEAYPCKMGDGEAPVAAEFRVKYLGSMLSKNFDDSVTIMARIRLARIAS